MAAVHPAAALFPLLNDTELKALADDIKANGLREKLKLWKGQLLDGRNRLAACVIAGVEPIYETLKLDDEYAAITYVISQNLHRRHLDVGQRSMLGRDLKPHLAAAARARMVKAGQDNAAKGGKARHGKDPSARPEIGAGADRSGRVARQLAEQLNVAHSSIAQADKVATAAPDLAAKVKAGKMKLNAAYKETMNRARRASPISEQQEEALARKVLDDGGTMDGTAKEFGVSNTIARRAVARERGRREATVERPDLPLRKQQDIELARRLRELQAGYDRDLQAAVRQRLEEGGVLEWYRDKIATAEKAIKARKGVFTAAEYRMIVACLHPDVVASLGEGTQRRFEKAFIAMEAKKTELLAEKEMPTSTAPMPRTYDELMKRRAEVQAKRKAARASKTNGSVAHR